MAKKTRSSLLVSPKSRQTIWNKSLFKIGGVIVAVCALFWIAIQFQFVNWDDPIHILENPILRTGHIAQFWQEPYERLYIPVAYTLWSILAWIAENPLTGNLDPAVFHVANVLVHALSAVMVYLIVRDHFRHEGAAIIGALVFAWHPLQVEPVAWISGFRDVLGGFWSLVALRYYLLPGDSAASRRRLYFLIATLSLILAILCKPSAAVVPVMAWILDVGIRRRSMKIATKSLASWFILAAAAVLLTRWSQPAMDKLTAAWWFRPIVAADAMVFYLGKLVWPTELTIDYGRTPTWLIQSGAWLWTMGVLVVVVTGVGWAIRRSRERRELTAIACLLPAGLLAVLGLVSFDFQQISTVADRYMYMAMLAPALLAGWTISRHRNKATLTAGIALLVVLAGVSWHQLSFWRNSILLCQHAAKINPKSLTAYTGLAAAYVDAGRAGEAVEQCRLGLQIDPEHVRLLTTCGTALAKQGQLEEAAAMYHRALARDPDDIRPLVSLAGLLAEQSRIDEALPLIQRVLKNRPDYAPARLNFGTMLAQKGRFTEAEQQLQCAVALSPTDARAHTNLAVVLAALGKNEQAITQYRIALTLNPNFPPAQRGLEQLLRTPRQSTKNIR